MSTALIIAIVVVVLIVAALAVTFARRAAAEREIERKRLSGEASAHREQADSNVGRAKELGREAEVHRAEAERHAVAADEHAEAASEHAEKATKLEQSVQTAGKAAAFHDEQAADREEKLA